MTDHVPFLTPSGEQLGRCPVGAGAVLRRGPDGINAAHLLMCVLDDDFDGVERILRDAPAVPLLSGVVGFALALGGMAAGDDPVRLRRVLDALVVSPLFEQAASAVDRGSVVGQ